MSKIQAMLLIVAINIATTSSKQIVSHYLDKPCSKSAIRAEYDESGGDCPNYTTCPMDTWGQYTGYTCISYSSDELLAVKELCTGSFIWRVEFKDEYCLQRSGSAKAMKVDACVILNDEESAMYVVKADGTIVETNYSDRECKTTDSIVTHAAACDESNSRSFSVEEGTRIESGSETIRVSLIMLSIMMGLCFIQL